MNRSVIRIGSVATAVLLVAILGACSSGEPADVDTLSQQLARAADEAWAGVTAKYPDARRPEATFVKLVTPETWAPAIAGCMNDSGFPDVTAGDDGSVDSGSAPTSQAKAYDIALYACSVKYPLDPKYTEPLTNKQIELVYDYYKDSLAPCLEEQGFQISAPPSLQTFEQTYEAGPWLPYAEVVNEATPDELEALKMECPEVPPGLWD